MQQRFFLVVNFLSFGLLQAAGREPNWEELLDPKTDISVPNTGNLSAKKLHNNMPLQDITPQRSKAEVFGETNLTFLHKAVLSGQVRQLERVLYSYNFLSQAQQDEKWNAQTSFGRTALQIAKALGDFEICILLQAWRLKVKPDVLKRIFVCNEEEKNHRLDVEEEYRDYLRYIKAEEGIAVRELKVILAQKREEEIQKYRTLLEQAPRGLLKAIYSGRLKMLLNQE